MPTEHQSLGDKGERLVCRKTDCPRCKPGKATLRQLPPNFKCADVICDFCGFLGQVKTFTTTDVDILKQRILGAAWGPQKERIDAGIYYPLYLVGMLPNGRRSAVWYLPVDLQSREMFVPRKPLSNTARRAGWQGYMIHLDAALSDPVRIL